MLYIWDLKTCALRRSITTGMKCVTDIVVVDEGEKYWAVIGGKNEKRMKVWDGQGVTFTDLKGIDRAMFQKQDQGPRMQLFEENGAKQLLMVNQFDDQKMATIWNLRN